MRDHQNKANEQQTLVNQKQQKIASKIQIMSQSLQEIKLNNEPLQTTSQNQRHRRQPPDESLNTKNMIKKMTAKKSAQDQPKITTFFNMSNSTSFGNGNSNGQNLSNMCVNIQEQRLKEIQERMKQKELQIEKMKRAKYYNLYAESKEYKKKARQRMAKSMLEAAQYRRAQRGKIDQNYGYFKNNLSVFVKGTLSLKLQKRIKEKKQLLKECEEQKKSKDQEKKERANFKAEFIQKELNALVKELQLHEGYVNMYKEQLKLVEKQANSEYALAGWPIVYDQYQPLELLGKGGFGEVYKCYDLENNQYVALKVNNFKQGDQAQMEEFFKHVQREAEIMKKLNHPNICKFMKLLECGGNKVTFTLEYCQGPELSNYLKKHVCLEEKEAKQIMRQLFCVLFYLSSLKEKIIHYDIKPSNIMFHNGIIKILDFGLCKYMGTDESRIDLTSLGVGTYWYLPPETFNEYSPQISPKVDIWSAGVTFYEMLYGKKPYGNGISQDKILNNGIILNAKKVQFPNQTPRKYRVSDAAKKFISQCLAYNPDDRLSPTEAYEHQYFKK